MLIVCVVLYIFSAFLCEGFVGSIILRHRIGSRTLLMVSSELDHSVSSVSVPDDVIDVRKFSSSSGSAMEIQDVSLSIGNNDILNNVNWQLLPLERWALVGPNGAGKSTFLKALTGTGGKNVAIREGEVVMNSKKRMGYLEQKGVSGSVMTVKEEVLSRMERLSKATTAYNIAEERLTGGDTSDEALEMFEEAQIEYEAAGGYNVDQKIGVVLKGLGFVESDYDKLCSEFSGGWQMRIALARLLLSEPDVLILDEPTNHLDKGAKDWLANYLKAYEGTLLVVSHDLNLLNTAVDSIAEVRGGTIELYKSRTCSCDSLAMPCDDGDDDEYSNTIFCFLPAVSIHILLTFYLLLLLSLYPCCNHPS